MAFYDERDAIQDAFDKVEDLFNKVSETCPHIEIFEGQMQDTDNALDTFRYEQCNHPDKILVLGYTGCRLKSCPLIM